MLCELWADRISSTHAGQSGEIRERPCIALHRAAIPDGDTSLAALCEPTCLLRRCSPKRLPKTLIGWEQICINDAQMRAKRPSATLTVDLLT
jgi:hypothetical protein